MVRDEHNQQQLTKIRTLKLGDAPIKILEAEQRRKGFVAIDDTGRVGVFNTTAEKTAIDQPLLQGEPLTGSISATRFNVIGTGCARRFSALFH